MLQVLYACGGTQNPTMKVGSSGQIMRDRLQLFVDNKMVHVQDLLVISAVDTCTFGEKLQDWSDENADV